MAHEGGGNIDRGSVKNYLKDLLGRQDTTCIWFNRYYDEGWLRHFGIRNFAGGHRDASLGTPLLDENRFRYGLDSVCAEYGLEQKKEDELRQAAAAWGIDPKTELYKLHASYVGAYAEFDPILHYQVWEKLEPLLRAEDLMPIFELENELVPVLIEMRSRGVRIDEDRVAQLIRQFQHEEDSYIKRIKDRWGIHVDVWNATMIGKVFHKAGIEYPLTPKTKKPSFTQEWLESQKHELPQWIIKARKANKARTTFLEGMINGHLVNGRVHCQFNQLKAEREGGGRKGAVTGRITSDTPSLQVIPARDKTIGPLIRGCFIPEEGAQWNSNDYSQQEPRLVVHYSYLCNLPGSHKARRMYHEAKADFHQMVADMAKIERDPAKIIDLGMFYGMGKPKLAASLGLTVEAAESILQQYHANVPFVRALTNTCANVAARRGFIITILGRKRHFDLWEPTSHDFGYVAPAPREIALQRQKDITNRQWYNLTIRRAFTHKAMNSLIQGSAADQTKKAMVLCGRESIYPMIQLHDELCSSVSGWTEAHRIKEIMIEAVKLEVPTVVDSKLSERWVKY